MPDFTNFAPTRRGWCDRGGPIATINFKRFIGVRSYSDRR